MGQVECSPSTRAFTYRTEVSSRKTKVGAERITSPRGAWASPTRFHLVQSYIFPTKNANKLAFIVTLWVVHLHLSLHLCPTLPKEPAATRPTIGMSGIGTAISS